MRIKNKFEDAISELTLNINDLLSPESEVKSLRTFTLNSLDEKDYLPYELLISILWGNSCNNTYFGLEVVKMKRSCWLENSYFKYIYSLEFKIQITGSETIAITIKIQVGTVSKTAVT